MKKFLFSVAAAALVALGANAADVTWNFTTLITSSVLASGYATSTTPFELIANEGNLFITNGSGKFATDAGQSAKTWSTGTYTTRVKTGGGGDVDGSGSAFVFAVAGNSTVSFCAMSSNSGVDQPRKIVLATADGTVINSAIVPGSNPSATDNPISFDYTGPAAKLYLFSAPQATEGGGFAEDGYTAGGANFYMISATNVAANVAALGDKKADNLDCEVTGYFNLLGQNLGIDAPEKGAYIVTYDKCPAEKFVK